MTMNPGASMSPFTVLPFPPHTPGPPQQTPWMQHPRPLMTSSCLPGTPLGLSAFPRTLLVPSTGDSGPSGARPAKVIVQVRTEGSSAELPGIQTFVLGQTPLNWSASGPPSGVVEHAPPPFGEASAVIPATSVVATQACRGVWSPALSLQVPPPTAQLASIFPQVKACSGQHASSGEQSLAVTQSRPSLDDSSCNPQSVYQNYRRWQCFKSLARRHHPQSPDTEALSSVKEHVEIMEDLLGTAHSATVEPDGKYEEEENEQQQEEDELYPDPGLLSYIDKLCAQEGFITKVEAVIHPQFLEMLLSPESQVDPLSLRHELEEEEGLTLTQLIEKRLLELKGNVGVEASPTYGVPTKESPCTESGTSQGAGSTDNHNSQLQTSKKMSTRKLDADDPPKDGSGHSHLSTSKELPLFTRRPMSQELKSAQSTSLQRRPSRTYPRLGNRGNLMSLQASPISETPGKGEGSSEEEKEEEELPSLDFLLASQESLLPWSLSKSPLPAFSILHHEIWGTWGASQLRSPETVSLSQPGHTASKCKIPAQVRTPLAAKRPYSGADLGVSGRQPLTVGEVQPSLPLKRKCDPSTHGKRKKHLLSQ
ncbi:NUT family member 2D-like [Loxodonta africana]|uniref:NUT family member 2D-like n=1 Tax=Loxodonta africana TaxID=9785 RepID=UPI0030D4678B